MAIHARSSNAVGWVIGALLLLFATISDASDKGTVGADGILVNSISIVSGSGQSGPVGSAGQPVVVAVRTLQGVVVSGVTIQWTTDTGVTLAATSSVTDAAGRTSVAFTYASVGSGSVIATDNASGFSARAAVSGFGGDTLSIVSGDRQSGAVGTHSSQPLVVEVRDASGGPVIGRPINWVDLSSGLIALDGGSSSTDASGRAAMGFTFLSALPSGASVQALDPISNATVNFLVSAAGTTTLSLVSGGSQIGLSGTHSAQSLVVELRDAAGNPLVGRSIDWTDLCGTCFTLDAASSLTNAAGQARMGFTYLPGSTGGGNIQVLDAVSGLALNIPAKGIGGDTLTLISGFYQRGVVGTRSSQPIVAEVRDAAGNPVVGRIVNWTNYGGSTAFALDAPSSATDAGGRTSMGFTFLQGSSVGGIIVARDSVTSAEAYMNGQGFGAETLTLVSGSAQYGAVGSHSSQPIVVEVRDAAGSAIVGRIINWSDFSGSRFTLDAASSATDASGRASMGFTYLPGSTAGGFIEAQDAVNSAAVFPYAAGNGIDTLNGVSGQYQTGVVGTHSTQAIVVQALDAARNPIVGRTILWTDVSGSKFALDAPSSVTDAAGKASMGFTYLSGSTVGGYIGFTDAVSSYGSSATAYGFGSDTLTLVSGFSQNGIPGTAAQPIVVELRDAGGNPIAGRSVNWSVTAGNAVPGATSSTSDAAGRANVGVTFGTSSSTIHAQDSITGASQDASIYGSINEVVTALSPATLNGSPGLPSPTPISYRLTDTAGSPIVGRTFNWTVSSGGDALLGASSSQTDASGLVSVNFTYGSVDSYIQASDPTTGRLYFTRASVSSADTLRLVSGNGQVGPAGSAAAAPIVVEVLTSAGAPISGRTINWSAVGGGGVVLGAASSVTDASGQASVTFSYGPISQGDIIRADDFVSTGTVLADVTGTGGDTLALVSGNGQTGVVNTAGAQAVIVKLLDASGAPIVGRTVNWDGYTSGAVLVAATSVTDSSGLASMTFTYGPSATTGQIVASDPIHPSSNAYFTVTSSGGDTLILVSGNGQTGVVTTAGAQPLIVEIRDASGNPIAGRTVNWAGVGGSAIPDSATSVSDAGGRASITFTYGSSAASGYISGTVNPNLQISFFLDATGTESLSLISGNGQTGIINTAGAQPLVVEVRDASGAPLVGRTVTWTGCGDPLLCATPTSASSVSDSSGRASVTFNYGITSTRVSTIVAQDPTSGRSAVFTLTSVGTVSLTLISGNGQSGAVGSAGGQPLVVEARDASGNLMVGQAVEWLSGSNASPAAASSVTDGAGRASMVFTYGPIAAVGSILARVEAPIYFSMTAIGAESFTLVSGNGQTGIINSAGAQPLVVEVRDASGAPVVGRAIGWSNFGAGYAAPTSTSSVTDAAGRATMGFTYGSIVSASQIYATNSGPGGTTINFNVTSLGADTLILVSGNGQSGAVGTAGTPIVVEARDPSGNPLTGRVINWSASGPAALAGGSSNTDAAGRASIGFTYGPSQGQATITASDSVTAQTITISTTALGANEQFTATAGNGQTGVVGATGTPLTIRLVDSGGAPIVGRGIVWTQIDVSDLTFTSPTSTTTDSAGQASVSFTFGTAGTDIVRATETLNSQSIDMSVAALATTPTLTLVSGDGQSATVNTAFAQALVVNAQNSGGPAIGLTINWCVCSGSASASSGSTVTDVNGNASITLAAGSVVGAVTVTASRQDAPTLTATFNETVTAAPVPTPTLTVVSGDGQSATVNTAFALPLAVNVQDSGVARAGVTVNWAVTAGSATPASATSITDASGNAFFDLIAGAAPGPVTITATRQDAPTVFATFNETVTAAPVPTPTLTVVSGDGQSAAVNTAFALPLVVNVQDGGVATAGVTVNWAVTAGGATPASGASITDASGNASFDLSAGTVLGPVTVTATRQDAPTVFTTFNATVIAAAVPTLTVVSGDGQTGLTGSTADLPLVVELMTGQGGPSVGQTITWSVAAGVAGVSAASVVTDANGRAQVSLTYGTTAGPATVTAAYGSQNVSFTATAVNATSVAPAAGDGQSGPPGSTLPQALKVRLAAPVAAAAFTGRVTAKSLAGVPLTFAVTAGGGSVSVTSTVTDALGEAQTQLTLGPLPGTNTVTATFAGGATTTFTAITVAAVGSVIIVSGDNQTMATNTASAPLVVELRNATGGPVVGATVDWTGTNATPAASSSLTDANGRASTTATVDQPGTASVRAGSALLATSVSFSLNGGVAELPALTPQQEAIAQAIDSLCPALAALPSPSPGQQDLLARCQEIVEAAGISADDTIAALEQLFSESSLAQSNAAITAASSQYQNVKGRLAALRSGQPASGLGGLSFSGPGGVISLKSLMTAFADESPSVVPAAAGFDRWGFFASGTIGRGEADATRSAPAYDYDVNGLTVGVDYRRRDDWIMGAALGYSRQDTDLTADGGKVAMTGVSLSAYSTYSFKDRFYLDGVVTWGHNRFEMKRNIIYTLPLSGGGTSTVDQTATGKPGGDLFEAAVTFGGDFHKDAWTLGPYGRLTYTQMGFDGYEESMKAGAGNGLALVVDSREVTALTGVLGTKIGYTHSAEWGVAVPTVSLEWEHEFKDDLQSLSARFLYDPTATPIVADGDPMDGNYLRFGVGMSIVLRRGRSGFFLFDRAVGRDGVSQDNFSLGIRIEF